MISFQIKAGLLNTFPIGVHNLARLQWKVSKNVHMFVLPYLSVRPSACDNSEIVNRISTFVYFGYFY